MYDGEREEDQSDGADDIFENHQDEAEAQEGDVEGHTELAPSEHQQLIAQLHSGANWFYWIAALSIVNSVIIASGEEWSFIVGLGVTQIVDVIASEVAQGLEGNGGMIVRGIALVISVSIAGMLGLMGFLSNRRHIWAFILGMIFYAGDGLIFLLAQGWMSFGFHLFALFGLFSGLKAARQLNQLEFDQGLELGMEGA